MPNKYVTPNGVQCVICDRVEAEPADWFLQAPTPGGEVGLPPAYMTLLTVKFNRSLVNNPVAVPVCSFRCASAYLQAFMEHYK